jgi:bifunctional non-homologous end joining protein LigD
LGETPQRTGVTAFPPEMPRSIAPMLATAGSLPADDAAFGYEIKWDGVRALVHAAGIHFYMASRKLVDITPRYPELRPLVELVDRPVVIDGEVVAFDDDGRPSFGLLQHRMHVTDPRDVRRRMDLYPVAFMAFDVLWLDDRSTMGLPYAERRVLLDGLGIDHPCWSTPRHHLGDGAALLAATRARGMEGIVAKRLDSSYEPGRRSRAWIKVKSKPRQDVVVGGWIPGSGNRSGRVGALLAGYYRDGHLQFAGRVGTGFTEKTLDDLARMLAPLERATSPFATPGAPKEARFVEPVLVAEVEFGEWTAGGTMRHPSFKGFRDDVSPEDVVREAPTTGD